MYDKRVHRGNSYAAMVIQAGTNHDAMVMDRRQTDKTMKQRTTGFGKSTRVSTQISYTFWAQNYYLNLHTQNP